MSEAISRYFPAGTKMTRPTGGMCLWVELPAHISALRVYELGMAAGISTAPGPIFSAKHKFSNFIRLNYGNPWSEKIENAVRELGRIIASVGSVGESITRAPVDREPAVHEPKRLR
jgi:DNA-binding transcriptional MocR family regulator